MRRHDQLSLEQPWISHPHAQELETISRILDSYPAIAEAGFQARNASMAPIRCSPEDGGRSGTLIPSWMVSAEQA
jgi:hypothetical protein